jgi:membrane protein YqaA with SNARE-associated domain
MLRRDPEKAHPVASHDHHQWLRSRYAGSMLGAFSFAESIFLPVLIDPFLVALILAKRKRWLYYTTIAITSSVLGGIVAYFIGFWFFDSFGKPLIEHYGWQADFAALQSQIGESGFIFVLIGALTPIPYKLVALASGLANVHIITFILASLFGRIIRLGLVGYAAHAVGPHALPAFRGHLLSLAYIFLLLLTMYLVFQVLT